MTLFFSIILAAMFLLGAFTILCAGIAAEQHYTYRPARILWLAGLSIQGLAIWGAFLLY